MCMNGIEKAPQELVEKIDAYIDEIWDDALGDMASLIAIDSVEDLSTAGEGKPWGDGPRNALTCALGIAQRLGLDAHDMDGYIGYADLPGASEAQIATIAHSDIVPIGTGWTFDPYTLTAKDGYLFGRGILDDKGPLVLSLYAAHYFVREAKAGAPTLPYTLRCIIGANEETGMADVDHYLEHQPEPAFLFTPDADFPVCCGEKGLYGASFAYPTSEGGRIVELDGGTVSNAIPSVASAVVRADAAALPPAADITVEPAGEGLARIVAHGKGGHASMPEGTKNAIAVLVDYLLGNDVCDANERTFLEFDKLLLSTTDGSALGIDATDDIFDPLTIIGGTIRTEDGNFVQTVDSRFPKSTTGAFISERLSALAEEAGASFVPGRDVTPFYVDPSSDEIQILVGTFNEFTGRNDKAFTIGGGTYARHFKNASSFGPNNRYDERPEWVGEEHGPDEGVAENQLKLALKIYIVAITRLMELSY